MVVESHLRRRWRGLGRVVDGIGHPRLTGSFEMCLHRSPPVPNQETIESNEDASKANNGDGSIFSDIDQVIFKGIDTGGVEAMTE